jgi:hypothetical protein
MSQVEGTAIATVTRGIRTEVPFTLPIGVEDADGEVHREGVMRLATARDEIQPLVDAAVRRNEAYLTVMLLARTIVSIGPWRGEAITPELVEGLFAADFDHLQRLYERINSDGGVDVLVRCPECGEAFGADLRDAQDVAPGK